MPLSNAANKPSAPSGDGPPIVHPSDAAISAALHEVVVMAESQHQEKAREIGMQ